MWKIRLGIVKRDLDSVEKNVQRYKSSTGATDISSQGQIYLQSVGANDQKISRSIIPSLLLWARWKMRSVTGASKGGLMPAAMGVTDPSLSQLMTQLNTSELEYEKLKKTVAENNPILVSLRDQIEKLTPKYSAKCAEPAEKPRSEPR